MFVFDIKTMGLLLDMACEIISIRQEIDATQLTHAAGYEQICPACDDTVTKALFKALITALAMRQPSRKHSVTAAGGISAGAGRRGASRS